MKSVLAIMTAFAPINSCGSIPNTKLVKYLSRENVTITVISNDVSPDDLTDDNLLSEEIKGLRVIRIPHSSFYNRTFARARTVITDNGTKLRMKSETRPLRARVVSFLKRTFFAVRERDWLFNAIRIVKKELGKEKFDVIYSTYPGKQAHILAEKMMKKGIAEKWVADFRDPVGYMEYGKYEYKQGQRFQHRIERAADAVTIVSEGALEKFRCEGVSDNKIVYMPNGFDPDDFDISDILPSPSCNKLRIFYAGTLYAGKRDLTSMFRAVAELVDEGSIDPGRISIEYAGNEWPIMRGYAKKYGIEEICVNYGFVTRTRVLNLMSEIDCTVVCSHNTKIDKGVVTGKVFELLLVGKPIIAVVGGDEPNSELGKIVKKCNAGVVYEEANAEADFIALKSWLKAKYDEKIANGYVKSELNVEEREQYSYENIAKKLYGILSEL